MTAVEGTHVGHGIDRAALSDVRVLVVDDDPAMCVLAQRLLSKIGITEVAAEQDATAVVASVHRFDPDLILLDRHLGADDGLEVLRRLAAEDEHWSSRSLILVTGDTHFDIRDSAMTLGASDVLTKPYHGSEFADTVLHTLASRRHADAAGDFSELRRQSQELAAVNLQLRANAVAKDEFMSRMSHELRSPLTAILGFGELLARASLPSEEHEWAQLVVRAGRHLFALMNDVLDTSRIEAGQFRVSLEPVSVDRLLEDARDLTIGIATSCSVALSLDSGTVAALHVLADNQRLRQVLLNLLSNAIKYNRHDGTGTVTVTAARAADGRVRIAVADTGRGLDAEEQARLFTPFDRLHAEGSIEGTGLGLCLSRDLVANMNGSLTVTSTLGEGSVFTIDLPETEPPLDTADVGEVSDLDIRRYLAPKRVLYVEDLVSNVRLIEQIIKRRPDVTLLSAMLGELAIDLAREHVPDLILLDLHLPDLTGEQVLARLRADPRTAGIPIVIVTADATAGPEMALRSQGVADYLTKPIEVIQLLQTLDRLLT